MPATLDLDRRARPARRCRAKSGMHPETGLPITAGIGRYGPFVQHDGTYANLDSVEEVFSRSVSTAPSTVLAEKRRLRWPAGVVVRRLPALKSLGDHPSEGGPITVRAGRYGPYVNHGKVNATLPKDVTPEAVTLEQALALLSERAGKAPSKRPARTTAKKPAAKKPAAKTAKKSAAKKG
jgi:DNA topoisomerase-1